MKNGNLQIETGEHDESEKGSSSSNQLSYASQGNPENDDC